MGAIELPNVPTYSIPVRGEIKKTVRLLKKRLNNPMMSLERNKPIREGYQKSVLILERGQKDYEGLAEIENIQTRNICILAVDYLNGDERQEVLVNVPLKRIQK